MESAQADVHTKSGPAPFQCGVIAEVVPGI